jgi:hypothetical protein
MVWYGHTGDHDGDIALWLRLALVDPAVLLEVDSPTLLLVSSVLDLKFEDAIGLQAHEQANMQVSSEFDLARDGDLRG